MKKLIVRISIVLVILMFFTKAQAQLFRAELTASVAGSQLSGDQLSGFDKAGILAGAGVRLRFNDKWDGGFRILFIQKGSRLPTKGDGTDSAFYLCRLNYIEFPLAFRYHPSRKFWLEGGPSLGYLISSSEEDEFGPLNLRRPFYKFDLSGMIALGYHLSDQIDFVLSYWQSVLPIREHGSGATFRLNQGQYNSVLGFGILLTLKSTQKSNAETTGFNFTQQ
jgi:hypothetical protein